MDPLSRNTSPVAEAVPIWRKLVQVDDADRTARQLAMADPRARHPEKSVYKLRRRLLGLVLGESTALEVAGRFEDER